MTWSALQVNPLLGTGWRDFAGNDGRVTETLPAVPPMLATTGVMPPENEQDQWAYEMKWDGVRAIGYVSAGKLTLYARSGREITNSYPELRSLPADVPADQAILDGEIVAFDPSGRVSFASLQSRIHGSSRSGPPVAYLIFDLLNLNGTSLLDRPYTRRRELLESLELGGSNWQLTPSFPGAGDAALEVSWDQGLEGVVAKRLDAVYEAGQRSRSWLKIKNIRTQEVVIGGWRTGKDSRASTFGSLLCGMYDPEGKLAYVGRVGSGFSGEALRLMRSSLRSIARTTSPFDSPRGQVPVADRKDAHWVDPVLVGEVVFAEWTPDGRLWHPRWRGLRADKEPRDITMNV